MEICCQNPKLEYVSCENGETTYHCLNCDNHPTQYQDCTGG